MELLLAISAVAIIGSLSAQVIIVSLRSNKISNERNVGLGLAEETIAAARAVADERWQNLYELNKGTAHYFTQQSGTKWMFASGDENVNMNGIAYTRYFTLDNVSRDPSTRHVEASYMSAHDDPSTQKVTVNVAWPDGDPIVVTEYALRWRNKACAQTDWTTGGSTGVKTCPDSSYGASSNMVTGGTLELCSGGC